MKNVRFFLAAVKKATGNQADKDTVRAGKGGKPGMSSLTLFVVHLSIEILNLATAITRVILSSTQGPGIQIADL